jgi:hypothetical protein
MLSADSFSAALARDIASAMVRAKRGPSAKACRSRQRAALKLPAYLADFRLIPGQCRAKRCRSRYGVVRLSVDTRNRERLDRIATIECAQCGHTWRRTTPPALSEYQRTRLTLILPGNERRWYARGRWRVSGEDAVTIPDATQAELMAACDDWRKRNEQQLLAKARVAARKAEAERIAHEKTMATLEKLAAWDAQRAADEAAAAAREEAA